MKKNIVFLMVAFCAVLSANAVTTINIPKAGGLSQTLSQEQMDTCTMIVLTGELNSEDLRLLRRMAGYREHEGDKAGRLEYIDLSKVRFKSDREPYLSVDAEKARLCLYRLEDNPTRQESFSTPSVRGSMYGSTTVTDTYSYMEPTGDRKNYALLDLDDNTEVGVRYSYRMTGKEKKGRRFKNLRHIKGHQLEEVNGKWIWSSYIHKGEFCYDIFYGCPNMKVVIMPESSKCCERVRIYHDGIAYNTK